MNQVNWPPEGYYIRNRLPSGFRSRRDYKELRESGRTKINSKCETLPPNRTCLFSSPWRQDLEGVKGDAFLDSSAFFYI